MLKEMKIKNEELKVYLVEGKMYVIIAKLAEALDANKADVYNAAARLGKENVSKYVKVVVLNDNTLSRPTAKCIDIEGLPLLFKKIERKVDSEKLKAVSEFLNVELNIESNEEPKSNIVEFNPSVVEENISEENDVKEDEAMISNETQEDTEVSLENNVDLSSNESTDDAENIIDGILSIIEENKFLKEKVISLEDEVKNLQEELSKFSGNPLELESLREENESLKLKLKESEEKSSNLLNKANLIKKYIESNK